jgi:hypothetical protein
MMSSMTRAAITGSDPNPNAATISAEERAHNM